MTEPHAQLSYGSYLKIDELTSLQHRLSDPPHHDELLFIIIHQVYELWFKQMLHELKSIAAALDDDDLLRAAKEFRRVHAIQRVLVQQIDVLETMTPQEFNAFREHLNPASGFQSIQFREMEFFCGTRRTETLEHISMSPSERARLESALLAPSLFDHVKRCMQRHGFATDTSDELVASFIHIYSDEKQHYTFYLLLEDLIEFDEQFLLWRTRHVMMVERMIGRKRGTGGSLGAEYLTKTLAHRFFPELWEMRTKLGQGAYS
jgi:tryptophan 2,3-dioxygenase